MTQRPGPVTITLGCYALTPDNWPPAVEEETGLHSLPTFIGLDSAAGGPRGRRVILPTLWEPEDPNSRSAYWTEESGSGFTALVLTFVGPKGDFVATLHPSLEGYSGEGVGLQRRGASRMPQVQVSLMGSNCAGLRVPATMAH